MIDERVNILIVDDQPGKLMTLEAILEPLKENVVQTGSADGALKLLLSMEFAVILVDVCMPRMDGFELAEMIRQHPRFQKTAVIFISAVNLSDGDRLRGYGLGAVDYIQVPIIPEILRAKVAVFADLYRKSHQLERLNRELELRVDERTADLAMSAERLRRAAEMANFGVYDFEVERGERHVSAKFRELCGMPAGAAVSEEEYRKLIHPEDAADYLRTLGRAMESAEPGEFDLEYRLVRPDGSVIWLLDKGRAIRSDDAGGGRVSRVLGTVLDISAHKRADEVRATLASIVESSQDAIVSISLGGFVTSWNGGAAALFGFTPEEMIGSPIARLLPPELDAEEPEILARVRLGEWIKSFETARTAKEGRRIDVSVTISPLRDGRGGIVGASMVFRDITERKMVEAVLARDRATLERMVQERTAELQHSNDRLRLADRMATIGTLSAGLGHDMGNLLLPVRIRLDSLRRADLPESARADIDAIVNATQYLQRLARSLRLLAIDPNDEPQMGAATDLSSWWPEVEGMMHNAVPRSVALSTRIEDRTPPAAIGETALTQVVFNLVQNSGHALRSRADARIEIKAGPWGVGRIRFSVADNGAGMSEEIRRQCQEPFFTTKTRGMGTGLGLTLATGLIRRSGGSIEIASEPGRGTVVTIDLPIAESARAADMQPRKRPVAAVEVSDKRISAHVVSVLESLDFEIAAGERGAATPDVLITQAREPTVRDGCRLIVIGNAPAETAGPDRTAWINAGLPPSAIRQRLREVLTLESTERQAVS